MFHVTKLKVTSKVTHGDIAAVLQFNSESEAAMRASLSENSYPSLQSIIHQQNEREIHSDHLFAWTIFSPYSSISASFTTVII